MNMTPSTDLAKSIAARAESRAGAKSIKDIAEGRSDEYRVNPFLITVAEGFNVRDFDTETLDEHIDSLAVSIAANGVKRALKVRNVGGKLILIDGECRLRATMRAIEVYGAEIHTVPVKIADRHESDADAVLGLIVENSGLPVTVLGKAEVVKRLKGFGWSDDEIAKKAGLTKQSITKMLDLVGLSEDIKVLIRSETVAPSLALEIARSFDFDNDKTLAEIRKGQTAAAARGKTRVTKKAVSGEATAKSIKAQIAAIIAKADVETIEDEESPTVCATFSAEEWGTLFSLLKIEAKA